MQLVVVEPLVMETCTPFLLESWTKTCGLRSEVMAGKEIPSWKLKMKS